MRSSPYHSGGARVRARIEKRATLGVLFAILFLPFLAMLGSRTSAAEIPALPLIPPPIASARPNLVSRRESLLQERATLHARMDAYNAQCSNVMQGSDDETRCRALRAELSAAIERHVGASQRFSNAVTQAISDRTVDLERQIESVRAKIRADKESFRRLGIDTVRDAFEDWEKLTDGQRREFIKGTVLSGISASFQVVKEAGGPIGSFTPAKANGWISYFRSKGVTEPFIEEGLRKIGMTAGKPAMRAAVQDFADHIEKGIATGGALNELSNGQLEALAAIPGAFLKTPDAKGAAALGEAFVNFYFAEKAMGAIEVDMNQVIGVPEKQLVAVGNLAATMTKDVTELNTLKDELNQISGTRSATDQAVGNR